MEWIVEAETIEDLVDGPMMISKKIVRCKDCQYNYGNAEGREYNQNDIVCTYFDTDGMDASDYCSHGIRKTAESE